MTDSKGKPKPGKSLPVPQKLLLNFVPLSDPSPEQANAARRAIESVPGARVVGELPGTLQIEASETGAAQLRDIVKSMDAWQLAEEGVAKMPETRGLPLGTKTNIR